MTLLKIEKLFLRMKVKKLKTSSVIKQLEEIIDYSRDCVGDNTVWNDDIEALTAAIKIIKSKEKRKEKYFWIGITLGILLTLAFHFLWIMKVGF